MSMKQGEPRSRASLDDYLDQPRELCLATGEELARFGREGIAAFQLAAAQRLLARQAGRIPVVDEMLGGRDPTSFTRIEDFVDVLFEDGAYKSFDPSFVEEGRYRHLTDWLDRFTSQDLSGVDMEGCADLTDWCQRLEKQADIFVCHSSGTSGTLSFVPRSREDRNMAADYSAFNQRDLFTPFERNDVTMFVLGPRYHYRITQCIYDGLEQRHHINPVQAIPVYHSPEFYMTQGRLRKARARGVMDDVLHDPIVAAHREEVEKYNRDLPVLTERWTENLIENYRGKRIMFQGTFDKAWQITRQFQKLGVTGAFAPNSVFALAGGVKDGTVLPDDWLDQFQRATGVFPGNLASSWGMSEITGGVPRCPEGKYHFPPTIIPFLLEPHTRNPLARSGVQTGQIALLELNSTDCWGGLVTGDRGTIDWDGPCACGRDAPFLDAASIARL